MKTVIVKKDVVEDKPFPRTMLHKKCDLVVLFVAPTVGTVIHSTEPLFALGAYAKNWEPANNSATWQLFDGIISYAN